jgi:uncharacterized repeat protein (TIGR01451 family)
MTRPLRLLVPVLLAAAMQPSDGAVIEVFHDTGCSLHDAIVAANDDVAVGDCPAGSGADTIRIVPSVEIDLQQPLPTIDSVVTIESADSLTRTISSSAGSLTTPGRLFDIDGGVVTMRRLTLTGGILWTLLRDGGAGIRIRNGTVTLEHCVMEGNGISSVSVGGGAILARNAEVNIRDSVLQDNFSTKERRLVPIEPPPAPAAHGAGIYALDSTVTIERSHFFNNRLMRGPQKAVHYFENSSLTVADSYFEYVFNRMLVVERRVDIRYRYNSPIYFRFEGGPAPEFVNSTFQRIDPDDELARFEFGADSGIDAEFLNNTIGRGFMMRDGPSVGSAEIEFVNSIFLGLCLAPFCQIQSALNTIVDETGLALYDVADNGGPTPTRALHPLSTAVNNGNPTACPATDQRGEFRGGGQCDIGAFELLSNADIQISAVPVTPPPYYVGQTVRYDLNVFNAGPDRAHFIDVDAEVQNANVASVDGNCSELPCTISEMSSGGSFRTIELELVPFANGLNEFTVTATASPGPEAIYTEVDSGNNTSTSTRDLSRVADLEITKELLDPPPYFVGQRIGYEIQVTNHGPDTAQSVVVTDTPQGLAIDSISNCSGNPAGPCSFASLAAGNTLTLDVAADITATEFDNVAEVTASNFDPVSANNIDQRRNGGSTENDADLRVRLSRSHNGPFLNAGFLDYTVQVKNAGPDTATNVEVDFAPDSGRFLLLNVVGSCGVTLIPCRLGNIPPGGLAEFTVQGQFVADGPIGIDVLAEADQTDVDPDSNEASDAITVEQAVDLVASLTRVTPPPYFEDAPITYEAVIANIGFNDADGVVIQTSTENLAIESVLGSSCMALPCTVPTVGSTETIEIIATPQEVGFFDLILFSSADQTDTDTSNNIDAFDNGGTAGVDPYEYLWVDSFEPLPDIDDLLE